MAKLDLIDRTALVEELEGLKAILGDVFLGMVVERAIECVKAQPEAAPVARWEFMHDGWGRCSNCHRMDGIHEKATHCRFCGAKMAAEAPR